MGPGKRHLDKQERHLYTMYTAVLCQPKVRVFESEQAND